MADTDPNEATDRLIAMALRASHGDEAITVARAQLEKAGDGQRDVWEQIIRILSQPGGVIDFGDV